MEDRKNMKIPPCSGSPSDQAGTEVDAVRLSGTEMSFEEMLEKRIQENLDSNTDGMGKASDENVKAINKKLPAWSLEPPEGLLK
ncbi:MAG: hypothetical protein LUC98_01705 [Lachnospiraceae bacterium]|nr:hypothetical protein [Lachnospiraceae bacterium]